MCSIPVAESSKYHITHSHETSITSLNPARRMDCKQMERRLKFIAASKNTDFVMTKNINQM